MSILIVLLLCWGLLLSQVASSDCSLLRFPQVIYSSDILEAEHSIEPYIIDEYPQLSADLTHPLQLLNTFSSIGSDKFVEGCPFPLFAKVIERQASVHFEIWNISTNTLLKTTVELDLLHPYQCRYFSMFPGIQISFLVFCENSTHHRQYKIKFPIVSHPDTQIHEVMVSPNLEVASELLIYRKLLDKPQTLKVMRRNDKNIIQLYEYKGMYNDQAEELIEQKKSQMKKQTGLTGIKIIDYAAIDSQLGIFNIFLLKNEGILVNYKNVNVDYYDRWNLPGETITKIFGLIDRNIITAVTDSYLYFLYISTNQDVNMKDMPMVHEVARIGLKGTKYSEAFSIGEFVILVSNHSWNVFYLKEGKQNSIKSFSFSTYLLKKDIIIDGFSAFNSFLVKNQQYVLRKPSIKLGPGTNSTITLKTATCQHSISVKQLTSKQVVAVNDNSVLVWKNGIIQMSHSFCQGNNVSSSLIINDQALIIPRMNHFHPNLPSGAMQILNFTMITHNFAAIVARAANVAIIFSCYLTEPCINLKYIGLDTQQIQFRMNLLDVSIPKRDPFYQWRQRRLEKQLLVIVVKNMSISQYHYFNVMTNKIEWYGGQNLKMVGYKFTDFEIINYSPKKTGCKTQPLYLCHFVIYLEFSLVNRWSHLTTIISKDTNAFVIKQRLDDMQFDFKQMCSISNSKSRFMLFQYKGTTLRIQLFAETIDFYHEIGSVTFDNIQTKRAVCSTMGLAITNGSEIFFVSEDLVITRTLKLSSSTEGDKMSGNLLLHSLNVSTTEIYDAETGFLIQSLHVPLTQIVPTKLSNSFALKNGTILSFDKTASLIVPQTESFAFLTCSNTYSSASKIKKIRIVNDFSLPQAIEPSSLTTISKNVWNATVRSLKGVITLDQTQILTHFTAKLWPPNSPFVQSSYLSKHQFLREIIGQYIQIDRRFYYCQSHFDVFFGLTIYHNMLTFAYWNESIITFQHFQFEKNPFDITRRYNSSCYVSVWVQEQLYVTRRMFRDSDHVYLMRYQIGLWNSSYNISKSQFNGNMPRRLVVEKPKVQIFTLGKNGQCKIQEITSESLGKDEEIKDFTIFIREGTTFVFILTNTQVILFKALDQSAKFSAKLDRPFIKIDVRFDMLLLVSIEDDSLIYNIIWQAFPFASTLQQNFTLGRVQESSDIVGGVLMDHGVVIAFSKRLILYVFEAERTIYSIETKAAQDLSANLKLVDAIEYKNSTTLVLQCFIDWYYKTLEVEISFSLDVSRYQKLVASNERESKEYVKKPALMGTQGEKKLTTE